MKNKNNTKRGFTIVEVLVVVGILIVLVVVALFFLNPSQLASQGRDSNRLSDLTLLNESISLYHEAKPGGSLGTSGIIYISIPDLAATSTAGTDCSSLGLPALSSGTYHCAASSTYRLTNGTGWLPMNMTGLAITSPISELPIDPKNTTSTGQCYAYETDGTYWEVSASPESKKYASQASTNFFMGTTRTLSPACAAISFTTSTYATGSGSLEIAFDSHTNSIWVANSASNTVTQINDLTYATSTYAVGNFPYSIAFDSHTNSIWVASLVNNTVTQINDLTYATSTYAVGSGPEGTAFDSHTNSIWVTNNTDNTVTQIKDSTYAISTYAVGISPYGIAFDSHTNSIWVANNTDNTVTVFTPSR